MIVSTKRPISNAESLQHEHGMQEEEKHILGFWIFLASDLVLFACLFATYLVLRTHTDGGPTTAQLFDIPMFTLETFILLTSSFTCGLAVHEMRNGHLKRLIGWLVVTVLLGLTFVGIEAHEFLTYSSAGATMQRSAFLSAFFALVGTHGLHISLGIVWMISVGIQLLRDRIQPTTARKMFNAGLYWHFLDVVWILIYTLVYLLGVMK
jgi:cytochrome o ubiquinol oxidase subunit 3/cytochrome aa3-600 menaquinol oxidase subunit 3